MTAWQWMAIGSHALLLGAFVLVVLSSRWTTRLLLLQVDMSRAGYLQALELLVKSDVDELARAQLARRLRDAAVSLTPPLSSRDEPTLKRVREEIESIAVDLESSS